MCGADATKRLPPVGIHPFCTNNNMRRHIHAIEMCRHPCSPDGEPIPPPLPYSFTMPTPRCWTAPLIRRLATLPSLERLSVAIQDDTAEQFRNEYSHWILNLNETQYAIPPSLQLTPTQLELSPFAALRQLTGLRYLAIIDNSWRDSNILLAYFLHLPDMPPVHLTTVKLQPDCGNPLPLLAPLYHSLTLLDFSFGSEPMVLSDLIPGPSLD